MCPHLWKGHVWNTQLPGNSSIGLRPVLSKPLERRIGGTERANNDRLKAWGALMYNAQTPLDIGLDVYYKKVQRRVQSSTK